MYEYPRRQALNKCMDLMNSAAIDANNFQMFSGNCKIPT